MKQLKNRLLMSKIVIVEGTLETTTGKDGSYKLIDVLPGTIL